MPVLVRPDFTALPAEAAALFPAQPASFYDLAAWYEVFARDAVDPGSEPRLIVTSDGGAGLALLRQRDGTWRSLANYYSCEHAVLGASPADAAATMRELVTEMLYARPRCGRLELRALDPLDPRFPALVSALRGASFAVETWCEFGTWYEATAGMSFADYVAARPSSLVNTWRRKAAKAQKQHRLDYLFAARPDEIEAAIADYEAIYAASWKGSEPYPRFIPNLVRRGAALGAVRLGVMRVDGAPAAAQIWICWQGRASIYKLAHDARFDALSPGTILTMKMMERALDIDRVGEVDFGRGDDPYKKLFLPRRRERWAIDAMNPRTLRGLVGAGRQIAARLARPLRRVQAD
jgi:hypothetical protein